MRLSGDDPRAAQLELLNAVARIATLDLELRPMLQRITDTLGEKLGCEFVALVTIDPERKAFQCEALTTQHESSVHIGYSRPLGSGVVGQVAATGEPVLLDDVNDFENYVETLPNARAELCVPVKHRGELVAVLNVESTRPAAFHDQLTLLTTVADQVAGAIANAQRHAELLVVQAQLEAKTRALEAANTHLANAIETLHRISTQDGLTGVSNRRHFDDTLARECRRATRSRAPLSLLMVDVDHFKDFNDQHGHQAGDELLRIVAHTLRDAVHRAADLVARYGGEEFGVLLPDTSEADARTLAASVRASIAGTGVTVSIGVATLVPEREQNACEELVRLADAALYDAKRAGRNCVR
ncbi:MAG TPA: sensor domain-containing diguanylate cyclase [Thermoanaerobaculia bacterium]|nr:sensor domain-containing diguanylate cyclase [Thermoanaerobaculia bacterium]